MINIELEFTTNSFFLLAQEVQHRRLMNNKVISTATSVKDSNPSRTLQNTANPIKSDEYFESFMNHLNCESSVVVTANLR